MIEVEGIIITSRLHYDRCQTRIRYCKFLQVLEAHRPLSQVYGASVLTVLKNIQSMAEGIHWSYPLVGAERLSPHNTQC